MKYTATIELEDDKKCDKCPFARHNDSFARTHCNLGEFDISMIRSENPNAAGIYSWHTPRPRGCPLKPVQDKSDYQRDIELRDALRRSAGTKTTLD